MRLITNIFAEFSSFMVPHFTRVTNRAHQNIFEEVEKQNHYAELVKIAVTNKDPKIRYAAVLKLELAKLIYNIRYNKRDVLKTSLFILYYLI